MSKVLVVTGMHRSGTSLVANWLHRAGVDMGDDLLPPDVGNPLGYYEDVLIHDVHREMLRAAGIADGFTVTDADVPVPVGPDFEARAREIAATRAGKAQWGWKEPRTALFLDMWRRVLPEARFLFLFRRPLAVLDSLLRRAANASVTRRPELALVMWRIHDEAMLRFTQAHPDAALWWETESFVRDPEALAAALRERFGLLLAPVRLDEVYQGGAYHTSVRMRAKILASRNRAEAKACEELYERLGSLASTASSGASR